MGLEYTLFFKCIILPEYIDFIEKKYINNYDSSDEFKSLSKSYQDLITICNDLDLPGYITIYELCGNNFICSMYKYQHNYDRDLTSNYRKFMEDVIVPITSEILSCEIRCEEFNRVKTIYTDSELRNIPFNLKNKIRYVEHKYNEDETEIIETRVVYKRSIKKIQFLDLERSYTA